MPSAPSSFLFATCQPGAERALKSEVARLNPDWHPAFGRPGLVTFKSTATPVGPDVTLPAVFARTFGAALGPARDVPAILALAEKVRAGRPMDLHVFPRSPDPESAADPATALAHALADELAAAAPGVLLAPRGATRDGAHVLDVLVAPGEPCFVGHHRHGKSHSPWPGARIPVEIPPDAPSRAYAKLEEAIAWSGARLLPDQTAVEIGSAPGGASFALLRRGLNVVGVDPGAMAEVVLANPRFQHIQQPVADLRLEDLPPRVDWLILDVNLAPQVALKSLRPLVAARRRTLRGVLLTLKLNDWSMADKVPSLLRRIEEMGLTEVRATQLPSNRQEVFAFARGPKGER